MSGSARRFSVQVPDWGQDHLSSEAIAAYVDGELADRPYDRATRHLSACRECAAQVVAQGQASAALRSARCPSLPSSLMSALRSIPQDTAPGGVGNGLAIRPADHQPRPQQPRPHQPHHQRPETDRSRADVVATAWAPSPALPPLGVVPHRGPAPSAGLPTTGPAARSRRSWLGSGAAISGGLALGALAIGAAIIAGDTPAPPPPDRPSIVDAHLQLP